MKKITALIMAVLLFSLLFAGCKPDPKIQYTKYSDTFFDTFDTMVMVVGYTETEEEFKTYFEMVRSRFERLHKLYDIYNDYEGINNIKTINDNAGLKPVKVDKEIIDLIIFAKDWYKRIGGLTNIAMGSVLRIWHDYREEGMFDPQNAKLPPMSELQEAARHTDIDKVIVDKEKGTVYIEDERIRLDVGSIAKGYATEVAAKEAIAAGLKSGAINAGGNVRTFGKPLDGVRERWGIGIQDPEKSILSEDDDLLDTVFIRDASVVSSGNYQRYYIVGGQIIHHLIDPKTLMPGNYYSAVTVIVEDSGAADFLSTAVFLLPYEQSRALVEGLDGVEALWIMPDGKVEATEGMKKIMKSNGATGAKAK